MNSRPGFSLELKVALHPVPELYLRRTRPEAPPPLSPITGGPIKQLCPYITLKIGFEKL